MSELITKAHFQSDGKIVFERVQDVDDILYQNKEEFKDSEQKGDGLMGRKVATIPNIIIEKWIREDGLNVYQMRNDPEVRRRVMLKLNSPDYRYLRTHNSRL